MPSIHNLLTERMMPAPLPRLFAAALLIAALAAQKPTAQGQAAVKAASPVALVSKAETLMRKGEKEDAALLLWHALELLRGKASNPVEAATVLSARFLLKENDPLEMERRAVFTTVATTQADLAKSYRIKKWYDTADNRLDIAAQYDPEVTVKERTIVAAKRPKARSSKQAASEPAKPTDGQPSLLQRTAAEYVLGPWVEVDGGLTMVAHSGANNHREWICRATHEENQVVVEVKPDDPNQAWNAALCVGLHVLEGQTHFSGYRCHVQYFANTKRFHLYLWEVVGMEIKVVADAPAQYQPTKDGFHRFAFRIYDSRLEAQIDGEPSLTLALSDKVRGHIGLMHGLTNSPSCGVTFRNMRLGPLPADAPSDEDLRAKALETRQHAITAAVEDAKTLLSAKQHEPAAQKLRDAIVQLHGLPEGILRANLRKSMNAMLGKADKLTKKRARAATTCATALAELADKYVLDQRPRLALELALHAARFDPDGQGARIATIEAAINEWNTAQLLVHAAELAAPKNDGKTLREWFASNRLLDSRSAKWTVDGPSARVELMQEGLSVLMPQQKTLPGGTVDVHVRLPAGGCQAGIAFDAAGPHDYSLAMLTRGKSQLILRVTRWAGGKWMYLSNRVIPLDPWRLEAWHHIHLETAATGIKVKVLDTELKLPRARLGDTNGRIGLYAGSATKDATTIEIRGFEAKAQ